MSSFGLSPMEIRMMAGTPMGSGGGSFGGGGWERGGGDGMAPGSNASDTQQQNQAQQGQYFNDPGLVGGLSQSLAGVIGKSASGYNDFINNPTAHPAFQNALSGLLGALRPGEQMGRRDLADTFRAAGNTASSSYGDAANKYQQGIDRNRNELASGLLSKLYPQIASAMYAPISQSDALINALKMSQQTSSGSSTTKQRSQQYPPNIGGGSVSIGQMGSVQNDLTGPFPNAPRYSAGY